MSDLNFTTTRAKVPFTVDGQAYNLNQVNAGAITVWRNFVVKCTTLGVGGAPKKMEGVAAWLPPGRSERPMPR